MLDKMLQDVKARHEAKPVSQEAYARWRSSGVTKRLMAELELGLVDLLISDRMIGPVDDMGKEAAFIQAVKETTETVLCWKPQELLRDDDDE